MDKTFWRSFFRWLETAGPGELLAKRDILYEQRRLFRGSELMPDIRRMIRLIDEELVARGDVLALEQRRRWRKWATGGA